MSQSVQCCLQIFPAPRGPLLHYSGLVYHRMLQKIPGPEGPFEHCCAVAAAKEIFLRETQVAELPGKTTEGCVT